MSRPEEVGVSRNIFHCVIVSMEEIRSDAWFKYQLITSVHYRDTYYYYY